MDEITQNYNTYNAQHLDLQPEWHWFDFSATNHNLQ